MRILVIITIIIIVFIVVMASRLHVCHKGTKPDHKHQINLIFIINAIDMQKVGFETMTRGSGLFVKKVLSSCLFRHQFFTLNKNNKHLKTYLIIFINHFFIKNRHDDDGGGEDDGGDLVRDAKEALRRLEESADDDDDDDDMFE